MDELREKIAGEITLAESPGSAMKKWREFFGVTQVELAKQIKVSTSTISDYESNRRLSPGVGVIKRFVEAHLHHRRAEGRHGKQQPGEVLVDQGGRGQILQDTRFRCADKRR